MGRRSTLWSLYGNAKKRIGKANLEGIRAQRGINSNLWADFRDKAVLVENRSCCKGVRNRSYKFKTCGWWNTGLKGSGMNHTVMTGQLQSKICWRWAFDKLSVIPIFKTLIAYSCYIILLQWFGFVSSHHKVTAEQATTATTSGPLGGGGPSPAGSGEQWAIRPVHPFNSSLNPRQTNKTAMAMASADQQAQVAINEIAQGPAGSSSQQKCPQLDVCLEDHPT